MAKTTEEFPNTRCRIKVGWEGEDKEGYLHATIEIDGRKWAVVKLDGDDDPDMYKAAAIETESKIWRPL